MVVETLASELGAMDRISQLPDSIIHHILSFLKTSYDRELVRMSVLSKTWFHLTASFPVLEFLSHNFYNKKRELFFKFVDYTTSRFCQQNVTADRLFLNTEIRNDAELQTINRCLELVSQNGVTELDIGIDTTKSIPKYPLVNMLVPFSMLKSLTLRGCDLPYSLIVDVFKFKSLIRLELIVVFIDDEGIKYLTTSCPLLKVLIISHCSGFKSICLYGNQNLQKVEIRETEVERIDIEAPNLSNLFISNERGPPRMDLALCKALNTVTYIGHPSPNSNDLTNFLSNFPFIEILVLIPKKPWIQCHNLKLSSHPLWTLHSNFALEDVDEFSTPNLVLLIYASSDYWHSSPNLTDKPWALLRDSTHLKSCMHCYPGGLIDKYWFNKLRLFLDKKNGFKPMNLYIKYSQSFSDLKNLKEIELPPYELEHVELHLDTPCNNARAYIHSVDAVLCYFRPRSLTLRSFFPSSYFEKVVKFTYVKLLKQEDQGHTKIQIVSPSSSEAQKHFVGLKSLSMALPYDGHAISFIKEKVNEEEAESQWYADMESLRNDFGVLSVKTQVDSFGKD